MQKTFVAFFLLALANLNAQAATAAAPVIEPPMVTVPGGEFAMGSHTDPTNPGHPTSEPVHVVRLKAFRLAKYETTVKQFRQFVVATGYQASGDCWKLAANDWGMESGKLSWDSPVNARSEYFPVMCVSWNDAHAYLQWLSKETGKHYRLPSESEWEYAARARSKTQYPFGDNPAELCKYANVYDRSGNAAISQLTGKTREPIACDDHAELTTVVGMYRPNAFGLYDMLGNAGELIEDCDHSTYENAPGDGSAWTEGCTLFHGGKMAIHRGGNFNSGRVYAGPTVRGHAGLDNRSSIGEGFRIAEDVERGPHRASPAAAEFEAALAKEQAIERGMESGKSAPR
jgi:formylglycine-generating enzyme required for sulfatase activity